MSRTSLHRPRRNRAASDRPAIDTRLLPNPFPLGHRMFPLILRFSKGRAETHAWPKTVSLVPPPGDGRSIDSTRQALLQSSHCRDNAPLTGRVYLAGIDLAGESELPAFGGTRAFEPSHDSTVVTIGELPFNDDGLGSMFLFLKVVQRHWWTGMPHTEIFPTFVHILKIVWGCRRVVVDATGVGAGVAAFLRKSPRPSIAYPLPSPTVIPSSLHRHSRLFIPSFLPGQESIPPPSFPTPIGNPSRGGGAAHPERSRRERSNRARPIPCPSTTPSNNRHSEDPRGIWGWAFSIGMRVRIYRPPLLPRTTERLLC